MAIWCEILWGLCGSYEVSMKITVTYSEILVEKVVMKNQICHGIANIPLKFTKNATMWS